jgi:hypothetical protein
VHSYLPFSEFGSEEFIFVDVGNNAMVIAARIMV